MAIIRIILDSSVDRNASIVLGDQGRTHNISHTIPIETPPQSSQYRGDYHAGKSYDGILVINHQYQSFEEDTFKRWSFAILAQLADLIDKGMVVVELSGAPQTSAYVRTAHIVV